MTCLKLPEKVHYIDFFTDLVKLSYIGDIRTFLRAEKKEKARNMVEGSLNQYKNLYGKYFEKYNIKIENDYIIITKENLEYIFLNIREEFLINTFNESKIFFNPNRNVEYFIGKLNDRQRKDIIEKYIKKMNLKYSIYGVISGIFSTDFIKGVNIF